MPEFPPASLIVSTRNRPAFISRFVDTVLAGREQPAEIVIVDQSDRPHPILAESAPDGRPLIRYLPWAERGLSRGRNAGIAAATHDILAFADDDMLAPREWFGALIGALLAAPPRSVVVGRVLAGPPERKGGFAPSTLADARPAVYGGRIGTDVIAAGNLALRRSALVDVGPFDERLGAGARFPSSEDNDLGFRLLEAGYSIVYAPEAALIHRSWRRQSDWITLRWSYGRGQGAYFAKHASIHDQYMIRRLLTDLMRHLRRAPGRLRSKPYMAVGDMVYALALVMGAAEWTITERKSR
jgi:GT2 family glycosyltransferase